MLHLLGHDHAEPAEKSAMWSRQRALLELLEIDGIVMDSNP